MRRGTSAGWGLAVCAAMLGACGEVRAPSPPPTVTLPGTPPVRGQRTHVATEADASEPSADAARATSAFDALVAAHALENEVEREAAVAHAEEALLACGPGGLTPLLRLLREPGGARFAPLDDAYSLIARFGRDAVLPLCAEIEGGDHPSPDFAFEALGELSEHWHRGPLAAPVGHALMAVVDAYRGGGEGLTDDEIGADEERGEWASFVLEMLWEAPAAARDLAPDIARVWSRWTEFDADEGLRETALSVLLMIGSDARRALPILFATSDSLSPRDLCNVLTVAGEVGAAAPAQLPKLLAALEHDDTDVREDAIGALRSWGEAAPQAREQFVRLLDDPEADVRRAAACALGALPGGAALAWRQLLAEEASPPIVFPDFRAGMLVNALREGDLAERALAGTAGLSAREVWMLAEFVGRARPDLAPDVAARLARDPDPLVRRHALDAWRPGAPVPSQAAALLADVHAAVRVRVAARVVLAGDGPLADSARRLLVDALGNADDEVRKAAVTALAGDDRPIAGASPHAIAALADGLLDDRANASARTSVLVRCDDGVAAFEHVLRPVLVPGLGDDDRVWAVVDALRAAGPSALGLRDAIAALGPDAAGYHHAALQVVLAGLHGDARSYAANTEDRAGRAIDRLLAMGDDGRRGVVLLVGRSVRGTDDAPARYDAAALREAADGRADVALDAAIEAAAGQRSGGPDGLLLRRGAALLLPALGARRAVPRLAALLRDDDRDVRRVAAAALVEVESGSGGSVPVALALESLEDPDRRREGLVLASVLVSRGRPLVACLREIVRDGDDEGRARAAALLGAITGDVEEAAAAMRALLAERSASGSTEWWDLDTETWDEVAATLTQAAPRASDVELLMSARHGIPAWSFLPVLTRLGPAAAPAVPWLREYLVEPEFRCEPIPFGSPDPRLEEFARTLLAIGPAAKLALPDLRKRIAWSGDANGVVRDVIRKLEGLQGLE